MRDSLKKSITKDTKVVINHCNNNEEQKWIIDHNSEIKPKLNLEYCLVKGKQVSILDLDNL
jgi:hypothetical protein